MHEESGQISYGTTFDEALYKTYKKHPSKYKREYQATLILGRHLIIH